MVGNMAPMSQGPPVTRSETMTLLASYPADYTDPQIDAFMEQRVLAVEAIASDDRAPSVIFVCVHNAGRSQMSAGFARHLAGDRAIVFSGGSNPGPEISPAAVEAMLEVGIDISDQFPVPFTTEIVQASDVVVTMGCGDACPYFPGKQYIDWELTDPHGQDLDAVRIVRDEIHRRVTALLEEMGIDH